MRAAFKASGDSSRLPVLVDDVYARSVEAAKGIRRGGLRIQFIWPVGRGELEAALKAPAFGTRFIYVAAPWWTTLAAAAFIFYITLTLGGVVGMKVVPVVGQIFASISGVSAGLG